MRIHEFPQAPSARRVQIFLAEKGIELDSVTVDLLGREHLSADFLRINPFGMIPVLELDDGTYIAESMAICRYFEALHPEPALMGTDPRSQGLIEMWNRRIEINGFLATAAVFRNTHPGFVDRGLPGFSEPVPQIPQLADRERHTLTSLFGHVDAQLATSSFVAGEEFSVADITLLVTLEFADRATNIVRPERLQRWYDKVRDRPSTEM